MKQVPDRKKLRREYLKRMFDAYSQTALYGFLCVLLLTNLGLVLWVWKDGSNGIVPQVHLILCLLLVASTTWVIAQIRRSAKEAKGLPYVPHTIAGTLPADEILVRGSVEPPVEQSDVLLRAAQTTQETPKEELLRVAGQREPQ